MLHKGFARLRALSGEEYNGRLTAKMIRIYYFKGKMAASGPGKVRMLPSWVEENSRDFNVKVNNLTNAGYTVFTSFDDPSWNIEDTIRMHIGSDFGPGLIEL